jgi:cbb3-type cytochrome oxidase subunit 3
MKADLLSRTELLILPEISVILFVAVFVGFAIWAYRPGARAAFARQALMPLDDAAPVDPIAPPRSST